MYQNKNKPYSICVSLQTYWYFIVGHLSPQKSGHLSHKVTDGQIGPFGFGK